MVKLADNIWVIWISRTFVKKMRETTTGNFKLYRTLSKSVEISNYPDLLKSAKTTTGQLKQKSAWNSNYTEFVKNARNCKLKVKPKKCGNFKQNIIFSKMRDVANWNVNPKSAGNSNYTEFCQKCGKLQMERWTKKCGKS